MSHKEILDIPGCVTLSNSKEETFPSCCLVLWYCTKLYLQIAFITGLELFNMLQSARNLQNKKGKTISQQTGI